MSTKQQMNEQAWTDEVQIITSEFVQNDPDLGELMLDHSERYWNGCFSEGLTPRQALDRFISILKKSDALGGYKRYKSEIEANAWWPYKMQVLLRKLSKTKSDYNRQRCKAEIETLIAEIVQRYRTLDAE